MTCKTCPDAASRHTCATVPETVAHLVERYPALLGADAAPESINELLAGCGYRLAAAQDIARVQRGEYRRMSDCLACRVTKIIYCP